MVENTKKSQSFILLIICHFKHVWIWKFLRNRVRKRICEFFKLLLISQNQIKTIGKSRVFLLHHLWIVNYYVKSPSNIIRNENIKTGVSRDMIFTSKIVQFSILIHVLSWRQQTHQCLCFHNWDYFTNFWQNNWQCIIDLVERLF